VRQHVQASYAEISKVSFLSSFGIMDLLFFGLAVVTAYQIAARGPATASEPDTDEGTAS